MVLANPTHRARIPTPTRAASTAALQNMVKRLWLSSKSAPESGPYSLEPVLPHTCRSKSKSEISAQKSWLISLEPVWPHTCTR